MVIRYAKSTAEILRKIGCEYLTLHRAKGEGYWYFSYDTLDHGGKKYETETVYCVRLNDMALNKWVEFGKSFVARMETE